MKFENSRAQLRPIGVIRSIFKTRRAAPLQGSEGAPDAWLELDSFATRALGGLQVGYDIIIVITWLHRARRNVLKVHPRSDSRQPRTGVFATRSPDRPNPLGLHRVTVREVGKNRLRIGPIEARAHSIDIPLVNKRKFPRFIKFFHFTRRDVSEQELQSLDVSSKSL